MKPRHAVMIMVATWANAAPAHADESFGSLGWNDKLSLAIIGGAMKTDIHSSEDYTLKGQLWLLRFQGGWFLGQTRFHSLMGAEFLVSLGGFTPGALGRNKEEQKKVTLRNFFIDFDAGLNIAVLRWGKGGAFSGRLSILGGAGVSSDLGYLFTGGKLALILVPNVAYLEMGYRILPITRGWSGDHVLEHRPMGTLTFDVGDEFRIGVGTEVWIGQHKGESGRAPLSRALKGDYRLYFGTLSFRWR